MAMSSLIPKTTISPPFYRFGWVSLVTLAGLWAGAAAAQTSIDFGQRLPSSSSVSNPPTLNSLDSSVPLTVQSLGTPGLGQYVVYVNGESDLLLQQVRRVEPGAFRRSYNNRQVIQAGRFLALNNAQERVTELENRGILSEIVTLEAAAPIASGVTPGTNIGGTGTLNPIALDTAPLPINTTLDFAAPSIDSDLNLISPDLAFGQSEAYYVAIPSRPGELANLSEQLSAAGINSSSIVAKSARRGAFIAVGPYSDRLSAEVMVANIKAAGFRNARVYYGY
ncbi:MAG: hypothetical protein RLZZ435_697 [Cyanobacteriota bacterium]|jgi:hypothetical protein